MQNSSPPQKPVRVHAFIAGKVQGVGYRYSTMNKASQLNMSGWVRNLPDGRVEAVFEGDRTVVEKMVNWCHEGPPAAVVRNVSVEYSKPEGLQGFEVRR